MRTCPHKGHPFQHQSASPLIALSIQRLQSASRKPQTKASYKGIVHGTDGRTERAPIAAREGSNVDARDRAPHYYIHWEGERARGLKKSEPDISILKGEVWSIVHVDISSSEWTIQQHA